MLKLRNLLMILPEKFEASSILVMEAEVLQCFGYDFNRPTTYDFLEILITYFSPTESAYSMCCYLLELALLDSRCVARPQSLLAAASLFLSFKVLDPNQWNPAVLPIV